MIWIIAAILSAFFAGLTSILAKCGIRKTDSDVATALRTVVVLVFSWVMVFVVGSQNTITEITTKSLVFLVLSVVGIDHRADQGVVDRIPHLHDDEQKRVPQTHAHDLRPERHHVAFERKAHVASKVTGSVGNAVTDTKGTLCGCRFVHFFLLNIQKGQT